MNNRPTYVLGISTLYHDSAACLLKDGVVVAAVHEERLSRVKHDDAFPSLAVSFCLKEAGIGIEDINYVAYYEKPILKFDRILTTFINQVPKGFIPFKMAIKSWLSEKLWVSSLIKKQLNYKGEVLYCEHHESHAASSYYTSSFQEAAFLTIDGVGEKATTTFGFAKGNQLTTLKEIHFPHSLGLLYSAFTYYCGFKVNSGEYKLMGLAPYGKPIYVELIKEQIIHFLEDGAFELNRKVFSYEYGLKMINQQFETLLGMPARSPESSMTEFYKDVAASIQVVIEEAVMRLVQYVKKETGMKYLCLAGGVALNCVANGKIQRSGIFEDIWIQPASGDGGTAIGAALLAWHEYLGNPKTATPNDLSTHSYLGPSFSTEDIKKVLEKHQLIYRQLAHKDLAQTVAMALQEKKVVGWFQGKMEFGPRALGNRSILASPQFEDMQQYVNLKIKKREGFRPFAPIILQDKAEEWFEMNSSSKTMLFTYQCKKTDLIPSCVHVDGSSRVQTLAAIDNAKLHAVMVEFEQLTKCPVLINTSFNVRGEPIVCSPEDALICFFNTDMDLVVLEDIVLEKKQQVIPKDFIRTYDLD